MAHIPKSLKAGHKKRLKRLARAKTPFEKAKIIAEGHRALRRRKRKK